MRAYAHFAERGLLHGHDVDDWLEAERELRSGPERTARKHHAELGPFLVQLFGSRPNAPPTFRDAGMDLSGYREFASFCAIERLPALCDVWRSRVSVSGSSPTRPAASSGGGEPVSSGGYFPRSSVSSSAGFPLVRP